MKGRLAAGIGLVCEEREEMMVVDDDHPADGLLDCDVGVEGNDAGDGLGVGAVTKQAADDTGYPCGELGRGRRAPSWGQLSDLGRSLASALNAGGEIRSSRSFVATTPRVPA